MSTPEPNSSTTSGAVQDTASKNIGGVPVAFQLPAIIEDLTGSLCIIGSGKGLKATLQAFKRLEFDNLWIATTDDRMHTVPGYIRPRAVSLCAKYDERTIKNEHIITEFVTGCNAKAILFTDQGFKPSPLLLMLANQNGFRVFAPMPEDKANSIWLEYAYDEAQCPRHEVVWKVCPHCKLSHDALALKKNLGICPSCGELYRLDSDERIALTFDKGTWEEWDEGLAQVDPLEFPQFEEIIAKAQAKSGHEEAVRCGRAKIEGLDVVACVMEPAFIMGSMGAVAGEKITRAVERACDLELPVVIFSCSGGARMQEGLVSLMQMAKVTAALQRHSNAGLFYISVITDPTTGGVTASFATEGDIILAEPHALIGFAGRRVIEGTIKQTLPDDFQTAEFALEHGLIDAVVERENMRATLAHLLAFHDSREDADQQARAAGAQRSYNATLRATTVRSAKKPADESGVPFNLFGRLTRNLHRSIRQVSDPTTRAMSRRGVADMPNVSPMTHESVSGGDNKAWNSVLAARDVHRPTAQYYIEHVFDGFFELHGDRMFSDDGAIMAGIAWLDGKPVTVIAEEKGCNLEQRIARNFGSPLPEGYRKTLRLMKQAEKFGRPVICLVDTQGAFCGVDAEERGQGNAIAENLMALATLKVPVVSVILGEGGSGGALALALANRIGMQEHAVYSVASPEGFASILWKDVKRANEAADVMKMSAAEVCAMGIVEEVISEGNGPAKTDSGQAAYYVHDFLSCSLAQLEEMAPDELVQQRYDRFRAF